MVVPSDMAALRRASLQNIMATDLVGSMKALDDDGGDDDDDDNNNNNNNNNIY